MTPAEKAKYLLEEMRGGCCRCPYDSKEGALTCCNEIIDSYRRAIKDSDLYQHHPSIDLSAQDSIKYWQQVKAKIEKL